MRNPIFAFTAIALLTLFTASAADLNGKWRGDMKTPNGENLQIDFNFHVDGDRLTGTVATTYGEDAITEGTIKGDAISFIVLAGGGQFKITYKGAVAGDDLKFHVIVGDMGEGDLTLKRVK